MDHKNTYVAIMAGGIGSRFWPQSRSGYPKQFLDILNTGKSLLQLTYDRFANFCPKENIYVITNESYAPFVIEQLEGIDPNLVLQEPVRRNTAPCVAYVAEKILSHNVNANIVVSPSDHIILQENKFEQVINRAVEFAASNDALLTLGMKPTRPDTGYGYIQFIEEDAEQICKVKTFTEKPTHEIAKTFLRSGDFLWNSGMFVWNVKSIIRAFKQHLPEISDAFKGSEDAWGTEGEAAFVKKAYSLCTNISIDYGIMEKAENVYVLPADFGWSDVGTWGSLYELYDKDYLGNAVSGKKVRIYDSSNNMVMVPQDKLVVLQGINDYCIIDTEDVLLICEKSKEQEIKQITTDLRRSKLEDYL